MLFSTLDDKSLMKNLEGIVREFSASSKPIGLTLKYEKQLKNRKLGDNTILGVHKYTIQDNTVYVVATKRLYNYGARRTGELVFTYYVSALNPKTGKYSYVMPAYDITGTHIDGFMMLTAHFIQRLKERAGKELIDLLKEVGGDAMTMVSKGDGGKMVTSWGDNRLFGYADGKKWYIATMVTNDMLFDDQLADGTEIDSLAKSYDDYKKSFLTAA